MFNDLIDSNINDSSLDQETENEIEEKKESSLNIVKKIIIVIIGVFVFSGVAFGSWYSYNTYFSKPELEALLINSFKNLSEAKTLKVDYKLNIETKDSSSQSDLDKTGFSLLGVMGPNSQIVNISGYSLVDSSNKEKIITENKINFSGFQNLGLHIINNKENIFIQMTEIPSMLSAFIDLELFKNRWVGINLEENSELLDVYKEKYLPEEEQKEVDEYVKNIEKASEDKDIIVETKECSDLEEEGKDYVYCEFKINPIDLRLFILKFAELSNNDLDKKIKEQDEEDWQEFSKYLDKFIFEVYFDKENNNISKFSGFFSDEVNSIENNNFKNLAFTISFSNLNQPLNIIIPEESIGIEELIAEVMSTFMAKSNMMELDDGSLNIEGDSEDYLYESEIFENEVGTLESDNVDYLLDSDEDSLLDWEEINIYGTDPFNPDTDGDGYLDGDEIKNGFNPLGEGIL